MEPKLKGILPAIGSPCDENDNFLEDKFAEHAADLFKQGVHGLYVCGATGDGLHMRMDERKRAVEIAIEESKKHEGTIIVHVGTLTSRDAMELAEHSAKAGAAAVSSMPMANKTIAQLTNYYADIYRASQLPVLVYHIPLLSGQKTTVEEMIRLLEVDGVVGLKFSDYNLFMMRRLFIQRPDTIVFSGNDEILCPALLYGAQGGIGMTYNFFPKLYLGIYDAVGEGRTDVVKAMKLQKLFLEFIHVVFNHGLFRSYEALMQELGKAPFAYRRPRPVMDRDAKSRFIKEVMPKLRAIEDAVN